jgi:hypothetical protein
VLDEAPLRRKVGCIKPDALQVNVMKIIEDTPDRLTLEDRPWILGVILAVVILIFVLIALLTVAENIWLGLGMGLGALMFGLAFVAFVRRVIVIFDRGAGAVVIRSVSLLGQKEQTLALPDLRGAIVETIVSHSTRSSGGGRKRSTSQTHRPSLQTAQGVVPLTEIYSGGAGAAAAVAAINEWLGGIR